MALIIGGQKIIEMLKDLTERYNRHYKDVSECQTEISALKEENLKLQAAVEGLQKRLEALEENARTPAVPNDAPSENRLQNGFFDLNRSNVFISLEKEQTAKSAFRAEPDEKGGALNYELCNLARIVSYDNIVDAVEFAQGSCTLSEAGAFETLERGIAKPDADGLWHITKKTLILLKH